MKHITPLKSRTIAKSLTPEEFAECITQRPTKMLSDSNGKLKKGGITVFSLPAFHASIVVNGKLQEFRTCKSAGECAGFCFAQQGSYLYRQSMVSHTRNLQFVIDDPFGFADAMVEEINRKRKAPTVRIHDSGDMFNRAYLHVWFDIARRCPDARFYIYTKEVKLLKSEADNVPANFLVAFSFGGKQDHLIDVETDRHSKVFASVEDCLAAGYVLNEEDDRVATDPKVTKIGLVYHGSNKGAYEKATAAQA